jgi:hypothetical protein
MGVREAHPVRLPHTLESQHLLWDKFLLPSHLGVLQKLVTLETEHPRATSGCKVERALGPSPEPSSPKANPRLDPHCKKYPPELEERN